MPVVDVLVETAVERTFRAEQVAGMFDLPLDGVSRSRFTVEAPGLDEDWQIGLVTGPSGSGKTTVARQAYAGMLAETREWPSERGVIDGFGEAGIEQITRALGAVGFNTPPAWLRPYAVLSNGEKFRCELARALVTRRACVVFDEFTSLVDRQVARVTSAAVSRAVRGGKVGGAKRFVAVTCHADVAEWLEPDWVVDMAAGSLARRRLRRPSMRLEVYRAGRQTWRVFGKHHYLTGVLPPTAECYVATWEGKEVSLCAMVRCVGRGLSGWRVSRLVTLPDFQGLGIGPRLAACVAGMYARRGERVRITTSHPTMARALGARGEWKLVRCKRPGGVSGRRMDGDSLERSRSGRRWTATWEWGGRVTGDGWRVARGEGPGARGQGRKRMVDEAVGDRRSIFRCLGIEKRNPCPVTSNATRHAPRAERSNRGRKETEEARSGTEGTGSRRAAVEGARLECAGDRRESAEDLRDHGGDGAEGPGGGERGRGG